MPRRQLFATRLIATSVDRCCLRALVQRHRDGVYTTLNDSLAGNGNREGTFAVGINDKGQIVSTSTAAPSNMASSTAAVNDPVGTEGTEVNGINNHGQIVGFYIDRHGVDRGFHAHTG
jgi:hypothetical protein